MEKVMLINVVEEEEVRIAVLLDGKVQELYLERTGREHIVGNIHKGVVVNIVPNIEAAFVEFGHSKHGFLHVSDVQPSAVGKSGKGGKGSKGGERERSRGIRSLLRQGQELLIQVTKEGIGDKGPSLTTYLSLPGRYLVLMPGLTRRGVSRRIADEKERVRMRKVLASLDIPKGLGVIARTAGQGRSEADIRRDFEYLQRLWETISQRAERSKAPALIYQESDPVTRVIRDYFTEDIRRVAVDSPEVYQKVRDFLRVVMPHHIRKVKLHEGTEPLFHAHGVEEEIVRMHSRTVRLPSGGSIVLEQTEALVAIDVNSGQYKGRGSAEETAFRINMDAAPEIARQVRLRDLGGVVVIDFIDMDDADYRRKVEKALWEALKPDRARLRMLKMSPFCIVEMTRQRQRQSLRQSTFVECPSCRGSGYIKSNETLALEVLREIKAGVDAEQLDRVEVKVGPQAANYLNNEMRARLSELQEAAGKRVEVLVDTDLMPGEHALKFLTAEGRLLKGRRN